ncbi:MAG: iron chelate uptake ABC transporter family permease subunit [Actinomycetota bacterium]
MTAPAVAPPRPAPGPSVARPPALARRALARWCGLVLLLAAVVGASLASVAYGSKPIPLGVVLDAFFAFDGSNDHLIIRSLRVPRTVVGLGAGVALGLAGAVMQGVTRNPLAGPGILGVNAGASLAVVIAIYAFGISDLSVYVWFAFAGTLGAAVLVYGLGSLGRQGPTPVKLALAGAAVSALLGALTSAVLLLDIATLDQFRFWVVGSLAGRDGDIVRQVLPFLVVGVVLALAAARALNTLSLGDDVARSLGSRVGLSRLVGAVSVVLLVGSAVAAAGPIGFVGLTVPHIARAMCGPDYRWVLPYSALLAPVLLLVADIVGRVLARPAELEVGIVTAFVGAPFFIALVRRRKLAEL